MTATLEIEHGIIVLGAEPLSEETLAEAAACDEVFIVARAVAVDDRWLVDEDRARMAARERLDELRRYLQARGVVVLGTVGDPDAAAALKDAEAVYPGGVVLGSR